MIKEIIDGVDIHTDNAIKFFGDVSFRQIAKVFSFRFLYGGSAYAFYMDTNMPNDSLQVWERRLEELQKKYKVLAKWQKENYRRVVRDGYIINPTGRILTFEKEKQKDGAWKYSFPTVANYPVQSLATADIMPLAMVIADRRICQSGKYPKTKFIMQVHDSLIFDSPKEEVDGVVKELYNILSSMDYEIEKYFGFDFNVPLTGEVKVGSSWGRLTKVPQP